MKLVKFIRSFNVEEVPCSDREHLLKYYTWDNVVPVYGSERWLVSEKCTKTKVVPIIDLFEYSKPNLDVPAEVKETYIAISEEVEELLGKPYSALRKENTEITQQLVQAWAELHARELRIKKLEGDIDRGIDFAINRIRKEWDRTYNMENASWWRRLFKKWG